MGAGSNRTAQHPNVAPGIVEDVSFIQEDGLRCMSVAFRLALVSIVFFATGAAPTTVAGVPLSTRLAVRVGIRSTVSPLGFEAQYV